MEQCHYCGKLYHPMPTYTLKKGATGDDIRNWWIREPTESDRLTLIHVCHLRAIEDENGNFVRLDLEWRECRDKAEADGYEFRPDLTPSR
jgi:hypothetical protein